MKKLLKKLKLIIQVLKSNGNLELKEPQIPINPYSYIRSHYTEKKIEKLKFNEEIENFELFQKDENFQSYVKRKIAQEFIDFYLENGTIVFYTEEKFGKNFVNAYMYFVK